MSIKLASWNVNGLRACARQGFLDWFAEQKADVVCLQEIKARPEQLDQALLHPKRYNSFWHPAEKPGYSGVAIFSRREPLDVRYGIGRQDIDREGRLLAVEFANLTVVSAYFPNSQREHARLPFKLKFCDTFMRFCERERQRGKTLVLCGDFNIAHEEIDLRNPKSNVNNAGFLPQERAWMTRYLRRGYVDTFRHLNKDPGHYTWWSYRPGVRAKNIGWRLDYFVMDEDSLSRLRSAHHMPEVYGSDHCPIRLTIKD